MGILNSVIAYYNEPLDSLHETVKRVTESLPRFASHRVIIYYKGPEERDSEVFMDLRKVGNEVVVLDNIGREGETYLVSFVLILMELFGVLRMVGMIR
jgi:hypothetical protein